MGCWNKTCGLSSLHIYAHSDVYVVPLMQNREFNPCYTTAVYAPMPIVFESQYDDYGGGENDSGVWLPYVEKFFQQQAIEKEVGENTIHDVAIKREGFTIAKFYEACHEQRLEVLDNTKRVRQVNFTMIRKDIVKHLMENYVFKPYGKSKYTFQQVFDGVPEFYEEYKKHIINNKFLRDIFEVFPWGHLNLVQRHLCKDWYRFFNTFLVADIVSNEVLAGNDNQAMSLINGILTYSFIDTMLEVNRKVWLAGVHEGSQECDDQGYIKMAQAVRHVIKQDNNR